MYVINTTSKDGKTVATTTVEGNKRRQATISETGHRAAGIAAGVLAGRIGLPDSDLIECEDRGEGRFSFVWPSSLLIAEARKSIQ